MKKAVNSSSWSLRVLAPLAAIAILAAPQPLVADDEYEWEPGWGVHEEEWYDPSDWFDAENGVNYEEINTLGYDDSYYADDIWTGYDYYGGYGYDYTGYGADDVGNDRYYQWTPVDNNWDEVEGDQAASDQKRTTAQTASKDKSKKQIDERDVVTMRGTIQNVAKAKTKDQKDNHTFLRLEPAVGKSVLVDFGPQAKLGKVKLKEGEKIQVRGPRAKLNGKYVLVAQQVSSVKSKK